jgi:ribokinase
MNKKITVIGSINMDLVTQTKSVPKMGETVMGLSFHTIPGGKGANQAVAAAKLGADVKMIGLVGDDAFGKEYIDYLKSQQIDVTNVQPVTDEKTGIATILLADGDNSIIVVPGANNKLTPEHVDAHEQVIANSDLLLLQLEIPIESVERAAQLAKKHGVKVVLNPAPFQRLTKTLLENVDYITPNEHEADLLLKDAEEPQLFLNKLIVTRGSKGASYIENNQGFYVESYKVDVIDTTGAGDTFNGALSVALLEEKPLGEACQFACAAAALSVTKLGAQSGMPNRNEVETLLKERET